MMDEALQRQVAARMVKLFHEHGVEVVLVGSTAVLALGLAPVTSKDADMLAPALMTLEEARVVLARIGKELGVDVVERGWGTISLVSRDERKREGWRVDLLVPQDGPIPPSAARIIRREAVSTEIGLAANSDHVIVMKAVAYGDSLGKGSATDALKYEADIRRLRDEFEETPRWTHVRELLRAYPDARARLGARLIDEVWGTRLEDTFDAENR